MNISIDTHNGWIIFISMLIIISLLSYLLTKLYRKFAIINAIVSNPNERTLHQNSVPRGGGIIFSSLFILAISILSYLNIISFEIFMLVGVGGFLATLFGFVDDIFDIRISIKIIIQSMLAAWALLWIDFGEFQVTEWIPGYISYFIFWILLIWIMNAYNFMDGVDGMAASGAIFIASTLALVIFLTNGSFVLLILFMILSASVGGFLFINWPPAKIFMGDSGSVFLGYTLGTLLLFTVSREDLSAWTWIVVLGYFSADTTGTQLLRIFLGKKWHLAHRSHAYQNLVRITGSHLLVTRGINLYHFFWILPLTIFSVLHPEMIIVTVSLAVIPGLILTYKYGPVLSSS